METLEQRFWSKVDRSGNCWTWKAFRNSKGYGMFRIGEKVHVASRLSYAMAHGEPPTDLDVCHECDNPSCVRPDHLFLGTRKENVIDSVRKGRNGGKLSPTQVYEIRRLLKRGMTHKKIAALYSVSRPTITNLRTGRNWSALLSEEDQ